MANSTGPILVAGAIVLANEAIFAPLAAGKNNDHVQFNWRIVPATAIAAAALAGIEKISPKFGAGLAYIALITVLFARVGNAPAPTENLVKILGYGTPAKKGKK